MAPFIFSKGLFSDTKTLKSLKIKQSFNDKRYKKIARLLVIIRKTGKENYNLAGKKER